LSTSHEDRLGPGARTQPETQAELIHKSSVFPTTQQGDPNTMEIVDPLGLWAVTSDRPLTSSPTFGTSTLYSPVRLSISDANTHPQPERQNRRKFVKLLVVGAAGLVTAVTVGGVSFARAPHGMTLSPQRIENDRVEGSTSIDVYREQDDGHVGMRGRKPHHPKSPKPQPSPSPTQTKTPQPSPTSTPTKTPTPTGTVIGSTTQPTNSAVSFTNPADGQASWLVHMSTGAFVAVEQACTHAGVAVKYNASTGQFNCPAHGAIFNADGTNPQAPATRPLPPVHLTVNANGTITTP